MKTLTPEAMLPTARTLMEALGLANNDVPALCQYEELLDSLDFGWGVGLAYAPLEEATGFPAPNPWLVWDTVCYGGGYEEPENVEVVDVSRHVSPWEALKAAVLLLAGKHLDGALMAKCWEEEDADLPPYEDPFDD
jgi:hypothetical protein